eukprot:CAMPEP_0198150438 /NCGR_PEP_ID=MMETSP1443-20131203/50928_1 /TAXON_ID=186043 /ORGANISM="Entomoneis sp., Strain CCMP2396" /LENGTH=244 /DNA_ID=CAMNT_0043815737 /DNA_START=30 /DNA_END=764 /DNA_ORIENTATION=-
MSSSSSDGNETFYIIVGAAAGGGIAACVALSFLALKRRHASAGSITAVPEEGFSLPNKIASGVSHNGVNNKQMVSTEIILREDDPEVSTLGDPVYNGGMMNIGLETNLDEQTASVENDYDYHKHYLKSQGIESIGSVERLSSDASLDIRYGSERIELRAPAGKLGMVIDTPAGGVPMVHAIKADSPMAYHVNVGDRLITVDGDDVTCMTAMQVSKLIALKSDQERVMVFVRGFEIEYGSESLGV